MEDWAARMHAKGVCERPQVCVYMAPGKGWFCTSTLIGSSLFAFGDWWFPS